MKCHRLIIFIAVLLAICNTTEAQEGTKRRKPLMVSHLSADNRSLLRRPAAPKHHIFSKLICFKIPCRKYIGWRRKQRSMRFKGYKDGGKVPVPGKAPILRQDSTIVRDTTIAKTAAAPRADTLRTRERIFVLDEVLFELNSATFNKRFIFRLDSLVQLLEAHMSLMADISGHTDNTGIPSYNLKLSRDRAAAVAAYLIDHNISQNRITFKGLGSTKPIADNSTLEGRRKNRRVEILLSEE